MVVNNLSSCQLSLDDVRLPGAGQKTQNCNNWNQDLMRELDSIAPFDIVVVTANHSNERWVGVSDPERYFVDAWLPLVENGARLVVIRDVPGHMDGALECVTKFPDNPDKCSTERESSLGNDPLVGAAEQIPNSVLVDLTDYICDSSRCSIALGGVVTYRDSHHLTATFAHTLMTPIERQLEQVGLIPFVTR